MQRPADTEQMVEAMDQCSEIGLDDLRGSIVSEVESL